MTEIISSSNHPEDVEALKEILQRLIGAPIEPTGDIKIEVGGKDYVIKDHVGAKTNVVLDRSKKASDK